LWHNAAEEIPCKGMNRPMEVFGVVRPLVLTAELYADISGETDPEELALMQVQDRGVAEEVADVLSDLYAIDTTLTVPRADEGLDEPIGTVADIRELRRIAAAIHGKTEDDYQEGRVAAGFAFNHLINHAEDSGYYVPVDFLQSFVVGDSSVGSAVALLRELEMLDLVLAEMFPQEYNLATNTPIEEYLELPGPVGVWRALRRLCQSAIDLDLPVQLG